MEQASRWEGLSTEELFAELRRTGDPEIRAALIRRHEGLARHIARRYRHAGEAYEDLLGVAHLGLLQAIDRFDPTWGTKFTTFAVPTIQGEIRRYFRDRTWGMRLPRRVQELALRAREAAEELTQRYGRSPTHTELATHLHVSEEELIEALEGGLQHDLMSLEETLEEDEESGPTLAERMGEPDERIERLGERAAIVWGVQQLPTRERLVIIMRFFLGMSQQEVGQRLGISQMHVSRLQQRALSRLKQILESS